LSFTLDTFLLLVQYGYEDVKQIEGVK